MRVSLGDFRRGLVEVTLCSEFLEASESAGTSPWQPVFLLLSGSSGSHMEVLYRPIAYRYQ